MNESQILKEHQISKQTQITNEPEILKEGQFFNDTQITNEQQILKEHKFFLQIKFQRNLKFPNKSKLRMNPNF